MLHACLPAPLLLTLRLHGSTCCLLPAGKVYALKQMSKAHIIDNKLVAHVHREKNVSDCPRS